MSDEMLYWRVLQEVIACSNWRLDVKYFTSDFEKAIYNSCLAQFAPGQQIGCYFHFKQAIRKHMISVLYFSSELATWFMEVLTILMIIPIMEIDIYGIPYCRHVMEADADDATKRKWDLFWKYFAKQWMGPNSIGPASWNIHDANDEVKDFINRTNNPCESYNNRYNGLFNTSGRSVSFYEWVETTKKEAEHWVRELDDICRGKRDPPARFPVSISEIPAEYIAFRETYND
jgi:hypothetical protein